MTAVKRTLDVLIALYAILILIIVATGGFKLVFLGISIKATHLYKPLIILVSLIVTRLAISVEFRNFLLILGSVLFGVILMESTVRIWNPPIANPRMTQIHQVSPSLGWELVPGVSGIGRLGAVYRINSAGFRDVERSITKRPGFKRIMVVGDSFTFGMGVNSEDTYPKQLEAILSRNGMASETINCGVVGHNMWQHYEMLTRRVLPYQPDLVVLGLFEDDLIQSVPAYDESGRYSGSYPFRAFTEDSGISGMLSHLKLWNFLRHANTQFEYKYRYRRGYSYLKGIEERKKKWGPARPEDNNYKILAGKLDERKYLEFSNTLEKFVTTANAAGTKVLIAYIPDSVQLDDPHLQAVNRYLARVTAEVRVAFVDTTPFLEAEEDHRSLYLFPFDAHNSPRGLTVIAKAIAASIMKLELLSGK